MKWTATTAMIFAASAALSAAAYAQDAHNHAAPKGGPDAAQGHDAHCCKPDPNDTKSRSGMSGMSGMAGHDHAQAPKQPAAKKPTRKPATDASPSAK